MRSNSRPVLLAVGLALVLAGEACFTGSLSFSSMSRKDVLAMQLHKGRYGPEIESALDSGQLTEDEREMLRGFHSRYATEPFYQGQFPDGITVRAAIKDERKYLHDADPRPHGAFVDNDNEAE
jgi:hypothetical protein